MLIKFGTLQQILSPIQSRDQKLKFLKFSKILYEEAKRHVDEGYMIKTANFLNPIWRTAAILKIVKSPHLSEKSSDFDEIWYTTSNIEPGYSHVTKN